MARIFALYGTPAVLMKAAGFDMFLGGFKNITC
jgi:hypothetical protein